MNKNIITVAASVLLSGLAAFGIVKTATPDIQTLENMTPQGQTTRTVNLSLSDYPDFTYAAENAVGGRVCESDGEKPSAAEY